jgi:hypothetical protein
MTPDHPRWDEFCERLEGPDGCNFVDADNGVKATWRCNHDYYAASEILTAMGLDAADVIWSLRYFAERGGHCDCEILFNVDQADVDRADEG